MKPSSFLKELPPIDIFTSNFNIIQSENKELISSLQLNQVSENISKNIKSHIFNLGFSNLEKIKNQEITLRLLAIRLKTSVRNVKNQNYIKIRKEAYNNAIQSIDNYVEFHSDLKTFTDSLQNDKFKSELEGNHFFFLNITSSLSIVNISNFFKNYSNPENYVNLALRTLSKIQRITKSTCYVGINIEDEFEVEESYSLVKVIDNHLEVLDKRFYFTKKEEIIKIDYNNNFRVDPKTGLFCKLQNEDVLNLKELLITVSRTKKLDKENEYIHQWLEIYTHSNTVEEFLSKAYLSIVNKLEVKAS